jgi:hypothetical protein
MVHSYNSSRPCRAELPELDGDPVDADELHELLQAADVAPPREQLAPRGAPNGGTLSPGS